MTSLFEEETTFFADLILPVPIPSLFTYRVPREMASLIKVGARVIVQFGQKGSSRPWWRSCTQIRP